MKTTLTLIKADVGSVGGHSVPSQEMLEYARLRLTDEMALKLFLGFRLSSMGDDAAFLLSHDRGLGAEEVHGAALSVLKEMAEIAKEQGLYGAGQDLLVEAFSGTVRGMGPGVAEMEFEERPGEPFLMFAADKCSPGAFNLPLYLAFADPMHCPGLLLSPKMRRGFLFRIMDVSKTEEDHTIELSAPEDLYDIAVLLRETERFVVESICSKTTGEQAAVVSTSRLRNIAGKYVGKDDPVALVRVQGDFPAAGEILEPYAIGHYVDGGMRGSHNGPLMPVLTGTTASYFDGPPMVSCLMFSIHEGRLTGPIDAFAHPFWEYVRNRVSEKAVEIRQQGFFEPAMLPCTELEYGGISERLAKLEERFQRPSSDGRPRDEVSVSSH